MIRLTRWVLPCLCLWALAGPARAGWVVRWNNVQIKKSGERLDAEPSTMRIDRNRVRVEQPNVTTIIDYNRKRFTVMNPKREIFWSGSADDYIKTLVDERSRSLRKRGRAARAGGRVAELPEVDESRLPQIKIVRSVQHETIAGHDAVKYVILTSEEPFEEMWVAEDLDLSRDLSPKKFLAYQRKIGAVRLGKSADAYNALYRDEQYRKILDRGFAVKTIVHHIAGGFERTVTDIRRADVDGKLFKVGRNYRRARLAQVLAPEEKPGDAQAR